MARPGEESVRIETGRQVVYPTVMRGGIVDLCADHKKIFESHSNYANQLAGDLGLPQDEQASMEPHEGTCAECARRSSGSELANQLNLALPPGYLKKQDQSDRRPRKRFTPGQTRTKPLPPLPQSLNAAQASRDEPRPLPEKLYHVTTARDEVLKHGLKTRTELGQQYGHGLGGQHDDVISLTDHKPTADHLLHSLHEYHDVLNGKIKLADLKDKARQGVGANAPYDYMLADHSDEDIASADNGRAIEHRMHDRAEVPEDWKPLDEGMHGTGPEGEYHLHMAWDRPLDRQELIKHRSDVYKKFAWGRQAAGGHLDAGFVANDPFTFADKDPGQFALLHVRPRPAAQGVQMNDRTEGTDAGEWRTMSGKDLDVVGHESRRDIPHRIARSIDRSLHPSLDRSLHPSIHRSAAMSEERRAEIERTASNGPWYHGTASEFQPGDLVDPDREIGAKRGKGEVYMTTNPDTALDYGKHKAWVRGMFEDGVKGRAYEVEPMGPVERDDTVDEKFNAWRSRHPLRIVREVTEEPKQAAKTAQFGETDWDHHYPKLPEEVHRGLFAPESHDVFTVPSSDEDIARGLIAAHQEEHFPFHRDQHRLFGTHWSSDEGTARDFALEHQRNHAEMCDDDHDCDDHFEATPVVFHAQRPERHEIETDPRRLDWQNVNAHTHSEREIPIKHGAPVRVTGVSWLNHTSAGPHWHRHDLRQPVTLRAEDRDSPEDPNSWNTPQASRKTAALKNPIGGHEWFHGTPYDHGEHGFMDPAAMHPLAYEDDPYDSTHWNTLLGSHFTADHKVAEQFARGGASSDHQGEDDFGDEDHDDGPGIVHAKLHMKRPKVYKSEYDMDQEVHEFEHGQGNHIDNHINDEGWDEWGGDAPHGYEHKGDAERGPYTKNEWHKAWKRPMATHWLNTHPDKFDIAERYKDRLIKQGYDGVVYGNEFEKSRPGVGPPSAIAFHPHQIEITQRHHPDEDHLSPEDAERERNRPKPYPGQTELFKGSMLDAFSASWEPTYGSPFPVVKGPNGEPDEYPGNGIKQYRHSADMPVPLYHGTSAKFEPGDLIKPGHPGNFVRRMKHVYATEDPVVAQGYGWHGLGPNWDKTKGNEQERHPRVYEVRPTGPYGHRSDAKGANWASEEPWEIVREVWHHEPKENGPRQAVLKSSMLDAFTASWDDDDDDDKPEWCEDCDEEHTEDEGHRPCAACGERHADIEEKNNHETTMTDWDDVYPRLNHTVHRVLPHMRLPDHVHKVVHDESRPMHERGKALLDHVADEQGHNLGMHWSDVFGEGRGQGADKFAGVGGGDPEDTQVVLHAHKPNRDYIETDPDTLDEHRVYGYDVHDENEVPIGRHAPVHITGVSWRPGGHHQQWRRHDLKNPMEMTAMRKHAHDSGDSQRIFHCPFCGGGQVIGRSDGTTECEFCGTHFTVQVQPQFNSFPQTDPTTGMPIQIPGMPGQIDGAPGMDPNMPPGAPGAPLGVEPGDDSGNPFGGDSEGDADAEEGSGDDGGDDKPDFLKSKSSLQFQTGVGDWLSEDQYIRHLAVMHAQDKELVVRALRRSR